MSYKYIDPGFGIFSEDANFGFYPAPLRVEGAKYNSDFGTAFYTDDTVSNGDSRIRFGDGNSTEFFLKFDAYFPETTGNSSRASTIIRNGSYEILAITQQGETIEILALDDVELTATGKETYLEAGRVNTIWLHVEADGETGRITLAINGNYVFREREGWGFAGPVTRDFRFNINEQLPVSNFILSDEAIGLNETIVEIGCSAVETTMIEESGTYSSATHNDYVLQTLDPTNLYNRFSEETKVTAMLAVAIPAYTTGDAVKYLKSRVVDGDNTTDGDWLTLPKMTEEEFAELEGDVPFLARQIDIASDTTFAKLGGLKVGWVTGT